MGHNLLHRRTPVNTLITVVAVEPADLLEVVIALEQTHTGPSLPTEASIENSYLPGYIFGFFY